MRGGAVAGNTWFYQGETARLGIVRTDAGADGRRYRRTLDADEIQYQVSGRRTLLSQRGIAELEPGDFIRIPLGIAHSDMCSEPGEYRTLQAGRELPQIAESSRCAEPYSAQRVTALRSGDKVLR